MANFFKRLFAKEDPSVYQKKDAHLIQVLTVKDFLALFRLQSLLYLVL